MGLLVLHGLMVFKYIYIYLEVSDYEMGLPIIQNSTILLLKIIVLGIPPQSNVVCLLLLQGHRDDMG